MKKKFGSNHLYLVNYEGKRVAVCLSTKKYQKMVGKLEDYHDILDAEKALREFKKGRSIEEALDELLEKSHHNPV